MLVCVYSDEVSFSSQQVEENTVTNSFTSTVLDYSPRTQVPNCSCKDRYDLTADRFSQYSTLKTTWLDGIVKKHHLKTTYVEDNFVGLLVN